MSDRPTRYKTINNGGCMKLFEETVRAAYPAGPGKSSTVTTTCPVILESEKTKTFKTTHLPDHEKADILEGVAGSYKILFEGTGKKCYKDAMDAALADAKDYRSCGFVRPLGASV